MSTKLPPIIIDTREQRPLVFPAGVATKVGKLTHGDYSLEGFADLVTIERKSLPDLVGCVGRERDRFKRELLSLRGYRYAAVVVEASMGKVIAGKWRGKVKAPAVIGSMASWGIRYGVAFYCCDNPERATVWTLALLKNFYQYCAEYARRLPV